MSMHLCLRYVNSNEHRSFVKSKKVTINARKKCKHEVEMSISTHMMLNERHLSITWPDYKNIRTNENPKGICCKSVLDGVD